MFTRKILGRLITINKENLCKATFPSIQTVQALIPATRQISCTRCRYQQEENEGEEKKKPGTKNPKMEGRKGYIPRQIDVQTSIRYMESEAYRDVYKDEPVWKPYRRNQKGQAPIPPRKTCIRAGVISTGSACPICRDDYLLLDYRNVKLLRQFISDVTGEPINYRQTGLCEKQIKRLELEIAKARDYGYLEKHIPFRQYNYQYYKDLVKNKQTSEHSEQNQSTDNSKPQTVSHSAGSSS